MAIEEPQDVLVENRYKSAEEILATEDTTTDDVFVPEWQSWVKVRGITKRQQIDIRNSSMVEGEPDAEKAQMGLWLAAVVQPQFNESQIAALFEKNAGAVDRVLSRVLELSGMKEEALKEKKSSFR